jgi:hypothetical protein
MENVYLSSTEKGMVRSDMSKHALIFFFTARVHIIRSTIKILAANTHCKYFLKISEFTHYFRTRNRLYQRFVQPFHCHAVWICPFPLRRHILTVFVGCPKSQHRVSISMYGFRKLGISLAETHFAALVREQGSSRVQSCEPRSYSSESS